MLSTLIKLFIIVLINLLCLFEVQNSNILDDKYGKLLHVTVIFRHGERAPYVTYPRDPYKSYPWPGGLGQLFESGKLRSYNLGEWFRKRYKKLLDTVTTHTRIMVESSDVDRTIMSAQYLMASFYRPKKKQERIDPKIRWRPIPIHTTSIDEKNYIWVNVPCPKADRYVEKFFQSSKMRKNYDKNKKIFAYLRRHTGHTFSRDTLNVDFWKLYEILDILNIQKSENLTLPSWTKKVYPGRLQKLLDLFLYKEFAETKILRFIVGPMFKSIISDMIANLNQTNGRSKLFHFYSGHDNSISPMMYAFGNYPGINPPYGAALIMELRQKNNENFVVVHYKNSSTSIVHTMETPNCGKPCTLDRFMKMSTPLMVKNWKTECQLKK